MGSQRGQLQSCPGISPLTDPQGRGVAAQGQAFRIPLAAAQLEGLCLLNQPVLVAPHG